MFGLQSGESLLRNLLGEPRPATSGSRADGGRNAHQALVSVQVVADR
jgi:hypothetical protein